jgi:hypothetical protein
MLDELESQWFYLIFKARLQKFSPGTLRSKTIPANSFFFFFFFFVVPMIKHYSTN